MYRQNCCQCLYIFVKTEVTCIKIDVTFPPGIMDLNPWMQRKSSLEAPELAISLMKAYFCPRFPKNVNFVCKMDAKDFSKNWLMSMNF